MVRNNYLLINQTKLTKFKELWELLITKKNEEFQFVLKAETDILAGEGYNQSGLFERY
jgi:hypothetical protein